VLRAVQVAVDDGLAKPILIGRPAVIEARIAKAGLRMQLGKDVEICNPEDDPRFRQYWETYHKLMGRNGVTPEAAKAAVRRSNTLIAALMVHLGDADAMLCGLVGRFDSHLAHLEDVLGLKKGANEFATVNAVMLESGTLFVADTYINDAPAPKNWPRSPRWLPTKWPASACHPRWPSSRTATTVRPHAARPARCALHATCSPPPTPASNAMAKCTATRPWTPACAATPCWSPR
jgi:hypothetical protein